MAKDKKVITIALIIIAFFAVVVMGIFIGSSSTTDAAANESESNTKTNTKNPDLPQISERIDDLESILIVKGSRNPFNPNEPIKNSLVYKSYNERSLEDVLFELLPNTKVQSSKRYFLFVNKDTTSLYLIDFNGKSGWIDDSDVSITTETTSN